MESIRIKDGIHWVGARDSDLRVFDIVMNTPHGTTYNSYLVTGSQTAVIDGVKDYTWEQQQARIENLASPGDIKYLIVNHTEPDHAGAIEEFLDWCPGAVVLATGSALRLLKAILNRDFEGRAVKDGEEIDLGGKTLRFIHAPFWHWPDTMFTYAVEDKVLFSCDGFGTHYGGPGMFNDTAGDFQEAFRYYYDAIMSPFRPFIQKGLAKIKDLPVEIIAPSHGPIIRDNPAAFISSYCEWSRDPSVPEGTVVVAYVSAYGYTGELARVIAASLEDAGLKPVLRDITSREPGDLAEEIRLAGGLLVGSPTFNRDALKPVWDLLSTVSAVSNRGKPAAAFGSYGWSGEAVAMLEERLKGLNFKVMSPGFRANLRPAAGELDEARQFGGRFAELVSGKGTD